MEERVKVSRTRLGGAFSDEEGWVSGGRRDELREGVLLNSTRAEPRSPVEESAK